MLSNGKEIFGYAQATQTTGCNPSIKSGLTSSIQDLSALVENSANLVFKLESSLGITHPTVDTEGKVEPSSMNNALCQLSGKLRRTNNDLEEAIIHINA